MQARERRVSTRARARLRPAKVFGADGRFLCDCAIKDRSGTGARIGLFGPLEAPGGDLVLFDESESLRWDARLVWHADRQAGLAFASAPLPVEGVEAERFGGRYYAVAG